MRSGHLVALDGLRGIAALSVVLYHLGHWLNVPGLAPNSGLAVDFFFCLSGYVLSLAYKTKLDSQMTVSAFMRIRIARLWPLIALATMASFAYAVARGIVQHDELPWNALATALLFGLSVLPLLGAPATIGGPQVFPLNGPQYTLFLELAVNLIWAAHRQLRRSPLVIVIFVCGLLGVLIYGLGGDETKTFWAGFPRVLASYFLGVFLHLMGEKLPRFMTQKWIFWAGTILMMAFFYLPSSVPSLLPVLWIAIVSPLLVLNGARMELFGRGRAVALFLGRLSYPMYALHYPIFCWFNGIFQMRAGRQVPASEIPLALIAILGVSYLALLLDETLRKSLTRKFDTITPTYA